MSIGFDYFFYYSNQNVGVNKKINDTVGAVTCLGYKAREIRISGGFFSKRFKMFLAILKSNAEIIVLRNDFLLPIVYFPILLWKRLCGVVVVIDIPTPMTTVIREFFTGPVTGRLVGVLKTILMIAQHPWTLWPANCVLEYSDESWWFSLGIKNKIRKEGNGILLPERSPDFNTLRNSFDCKFVGVGLIADWHGYDRLICGLGEYYKNLAPSTGCPRQVSFEVIGDGPAIPSLKALVTKEGLTEYVKFSGVIVGSDLERVLLESDIAVGTLGLHRKGLFSAAPLKNREYCSVGLPFVCSHDDPDFLEQDFVRFLEANDKAVDIADLLCWLDSLKQDTSYRDKIYSYCKLHIDYRGKWKRILNKILPDACR